MSQPVTRDIEIINKLGLHARAASKLVNCAGKYSAKIEITNPGGQVADAKSIMSVLMLAASKGTQLTLKAEGNDAETALDDLCALINDRFEEGE